MSEPIEKFLAELKPVLDATEEVLSDWSGEGNLQFPVLLGMIAVKLNWDEKNVRENDPHVRSFVRKHPDWYVTRGAHGGIMRSAEKQKKMAEIAAKELAKKQMKEAIEAKAAEQATTIPSTKDSE
jgi:hypothetical protein